MISAKKAKGGVTVFSSLIFMLIAGVIIAAFQSAVIYASITCAQRAATLSVENLMTQFHPLLKEYYGIMALDGGFGTSKFQIDAIKNMLSDDFIDNLEGSALWQNGELIDTMEPVFTMLGDDEWVYMQREIFLEWAEKMKEETLGNIADIWNQTKDTVSDNLQREENLAENNYQDRISTEDTPEENQDKEPENNKPDIDPRDSLASILKEGLLNAMIPKDYELSEKICDISEVSFPEKPGLSWKGSFDFKTAEDVTQLSKDLTTHMGIKATVKTTEEAIALYTYIPEVFNCGSKKGEGISHPRVLDYEIEYLLEGHDTDKENIEGALQKILFLRLFLNMAYLMSHPEQEAKVKETALTIASVFVLPEFTEVIYILLKLAWAYTESLADCRTLLKGGKIALLKQTGDWNISWETMMSLNVDALDSCTGSNKGVDYIGYLRIFMMMMPKNLMINRMSHLMEMNIRLTPENKQFKMSHCIYGIQAAFKYTSGILRGSEARMAMTY